MAASVSGGNPGQRGRPRMAAAVRWAARGRAEGGALLLPAPRPPYGVAAM